MPSPASPRKRRAKPRPTNGSDRSLGLSKEATRNSRKAPGNVSASFSEKKTHVHPLSEKEKIVGFDIDPNKLFEKESLPKKALQWLFVVYTTIKMAESLLPGSSEPALRSAMAKIAGVTKRKLRELWEPLSYRQEMS